MILELAKMGWSQKTIQLMEKRLWGENKIDTYSSPSQYISDSWKRVEGACENNQEIKKEVYQCIMSYVFVKEGLLPFSINSVVVNVPHVVFDLAFYTKSKRPICLHLNPDINGEFLKVDLHSVALKFSYVKALSYLITLHAQEAKSVKSKIKSGDVIGLDDVVVATEPEFDQLVEEMKKYEFAEPPTVKVITSNLTVTTKKVNQFFR